MAVMVLRSDLWPSDADAEADAEDEAEDEADAEDEAEAEADVFHPMVASVLRGRTGLWTRKLRVLGQGSFSEVERVGVHEQNARLCSASTVLQFD